MGKIHKVKFNVSLYPDQLKVVKGLAEQWDASASAVVRKALEIGLRELQKKRGWWQ